MRTTDADQLLMRRFQDGDEAAFEVLVHKYQGLVLSLCRRYLGSRYSGVEDAAQEVFVRIFKGRMNYEPRAKVKTWIYSITVNACLNEIRRLRSKKHRSVSPFTAVFGDDPDGESLGFEDGSAELPGQDMEADETAVRVRQAVDDLPEQQRLALVLSKYHHCSYEEVAQAMDTSIPAVKSLLTRARENLRQRLRDLVEGGLGRPAPNVAGAGGDAPENLNP
ncbi:MAG: RNA polymerase sigma factor [Planctomycetota bacterium]|jgi:RNA polymerase sigma-70 factor (ECF subfamily)